jgi:hypothetical protein
VSPAEAAETASPMLLWVAKASFPTIQVLAPTGQRQRTSTTQMTIGNFGMPYPSTAPFYS